jgi:hypothetical protein
MHLFVVAEGAKIWIEKFINDLSAMWLYPKERGTEKIQLAVREIKILDLVFPESCKEQVLGAVAPHQKDDKSEFKKLFSIASWARRFLGLKPIKEDVKPNNEIYKPFIRVVAVGLKEDEKQKGYEQL